MDHCSRLAIAAPAVSSLALTAPVSAQRVSDGGAGRPVWRALGMGTTGLGGVSTAKSSYVDGW